MSQVQRRALRHGLAGLVVLLCAAFVVSAVASPVAAHAQLVSSTPAEGAVVPSAPETVQLEFNERVQVHAEDTHVFVGDGSEVEAEAVSADRVVTVTPGAALPEGTVVVSYSVTSADGHRINGSVTFAVGAPTPGSSSNETFDEPMTTGVSGAATGAWVVALVAGAGLLLLLAGRGLAERGLAGPVDGRLGRLRDACWLVGLPAAVLAVPLSVVDDGGYGWSGMFAWGHWIDGFLTWRGLLVVVALVAAAVGVGALRRTPVVGRSAGVAVVAAIALTGAGAAAFAAPGADPVPVSGVPAGDPVAEASAGETAAGETTVRVSFQSLMVGTTRVTLEVLDGEGRPVEPFATPRLRMHSESVNLGDVALEVDEGGPPGVYAGTVTLPEPGEWTVEVSLRVDEFTNPVLELPFEVGRPATAGGGGGH